MIQTTFAWIHTYHYSLLYSYTVIKDLEVKGYFTSKTVGNDLWPRLHFQYSNTGPAKQSAMVKGEFTTASSLVASSLSAGASSSSAGAYPAASQSATGSPTQVTESMEPTNPEIDVHTVTVDVLVGFCSSASYEALGEGSDIICGRKIVKVSEQAVIKFGIGVTDSEANNQRGAYRLLDPRTVRVPRVYRFFGQRRNGHLIMESIKGQTLTSLDNQHIIQRVAYVVTHLATISHHTPGPLMPGIP